MEIKDLKFIQLNGKVPRHSLSQTFDYEEVKNLKDLAVRVPNGYTVIDVDDDANYELLLKILNDEEVNCGVMKTNRGGHFWFKVNEPLTNNIKINTPISIRVDVKCYGKTTYVKVKDKGKMRKWVKNQGEFDELPQWLRPFNHDYDFMDLKSGDGRNSMLFSYIIALTVEGHTKDEIKKIYHIINDNILRDKMDESELNTILRDSSFDGIRPAFFSKKGGFLHHIFANYIKNEFGIFQKNGLLYVYDRGTYVSDSTMIEQKMLEIIPQLTRTQRKEVIDYLRLIAEQPSNAPIYYVATRNGLVDIRNKGLSGFTPTLFIPNKINVTYEPDAYDEDMDLFLDRITCNDKQVRSLLEEMLGYILIPTAKFQKSFILYGYGSNGKSTFLDLVIDMIGDNNISSLSMKELNHNFKLAEISNKLANIGDDISDEYITDSSIFKKLVTGEEITVDKKHENPFKVRNYAKIIFATNNLPNMADKSNGMIRRLTVIPFNAEFSKEDPDYDPFIIDKLTSESAESYLLNLALDGITRVFENNAFTEPDSVDELLEEYQQEINNAYQFIKEREGSIDGIPSSDLYDEYVVWCANELKAPFKVRRFNQEIRVTSGYHLEVKRISGTTKQVWVE